MRRAVLTLVAIAGLIVAGFAVNTVLQPERHAVANACVPVTEGVVTNACEQGVTVMVCFTSNDAADSCTTEALAPGAGWQLELPTPPVTGVYRHACYDPFVPVIGRNDLNRELPEPSCTAA